VCYSLIDYCYRLRLAMVVVQARVQLMCTITDGTLLMSHKLYTTSCR
jgi:hypothetical protein